MRGQQLAVSGAAARGVVALSKHNALNRAEGTIIPAIHAGKRGVAAESGVHLVTQRCIEETHAAGKVFRVGGVLAQMLAEEQGVVSRRFRVEATVTIIVRLKIAIATDVGAVAMYPIKHSLDAADVATPSRGRVAEES